MNEVGENDFRLTALSDLGHGDYCELSSGTTAISNNDAYEQTCKGRPCRKLSELQA
jgi:hypothetical protein